MTKNFDIRIHGIDHEGRGVGRDEQNRVLIVKDALPQSLVRVQVLKEKKNLAFGEVLEVLEKSPFEVESACSHSNECGGCTWQNLDYSKQLDCKKEIINNAFNKIARQPLPETFTLHPAENTKHYRNKMEFAFGYSSLDDSVLLGLKKRKSHEVLAVDCQLCDSRVNTLIHRLQELVNQYKLPVFSAESPNDIGFLRFAVTRVTQARGRNDFLLELITYPNPKHNQDLYTICKELTQEFQFLTGIVHTIRKNNLPVAYGEKTIARFGKELLEESLTIGENQLTLSYSHQSFFQTNTHMTSKLYSRLIDFTEGLKISNIADIYCGVGGIGIALTKHLNDKGQNTKLYGLESMSKAIDFAQKNADKSQIDAEFTFGNAKNLSRFIKSCKSIGLIILDPPRAGIDKETMQTLLKYKIKNMLIVSCDPASLARDIALLSESYTLEKVESFDLFPHTPHVESLALLSLKK